MSLMASASDLIMLYLAIETTSIPLYVLAGFVIVDQKSVESGIKYLLFGAMTSAVMLFGFSFLYGFTGTTNLYADCARRSKADRCPASLVIACHAGAGWFWLQDLGRAVPFLGAGCL